MLRRQEQALQDVRYVVTVTSSWLRRHITSSRLRGQKWLVVTSSRPDEKTACYLRLRFPNITYLDEINSTTSRSTAPHPHAPSTLFRALAPIPPKGGRVRRRPLKNRLHTGGAVRGCDALFLWCATV